MIEDGVMPRLVPSARLVRKRPANRNRWYSPELGRFLTRDPNETAMPIVAAVVSDGQTMMILAGAFDALFHYGSGMNLYGYAGSNPLKMGDPLGLDDDPFAEVDDWYNELVGHRIGTLGAIVDGAYLGLRFSVNILSGFLPGAGLVEAYKAGIGLFNGEGGFWDFVAFGVAAAPIFGPIVYKAFQWGRSINKAGRVNMRANSVSLRVLRKAFCFVAGTLVVAGDGMLRPIEELEIGDAVASSADPHACADQTATVAEISWARRYDSIAAEARGMACETCCSEGTSIGCCALLACGSPFPDDYRTIDPEYWRTIRLVVERNANWRCDITLARPIPWLHATGATVGKHIYLDMPEMGISDAATVVEIAPCPPVSLCDVGARAITGTFVTSSASIVNVAVDNTDTLLGTTPGHPFWSVDRDRWVIACDLLPGETIAAMAGTAEVAFVSAVAATETVYNIEVHRDHTYFVSKSKLWVHNACPVLQTNQSTILRSTADKLNEAHSRSVHKRDWGRALEQLKRETGRPPNNHRHKIHLDGTVSDMDSGAPIGNLLEYLP